MGEYYHVADPGLGKKRRRLGNECEVGLCSSAFSYKSFSTWKLSADETLLNRPDRSPPLIPFSVPLRVHIEFQESQNRGSAVASCDRRTRLLKHRQHSLFGFDRPHVLSARRTKTGCSKYEWVTGQDAYREDRTTVVRRVLAKLAALTEGASHSRRSGYIWSSMVVCKSYVLRESRHIGIYRFSPVVHGNVQDQGCFNSSPRWLHEVTGVTCNTFLRAIRSWREV